MDWFQWRNGSVLAPFVTNHPTSVGINDYGDGYRATHDGTLPVPGFPATGKYAHAATGLFNAITTAASWNGSSPMFISVMARSWTVVPADCQSVASSLSPSKYVVVRPDQLFLLYRQAAGLRPAG